MIGREGGIPLILKSLSAKNTAGTVLEKLWFTLWNLSFHRMRNRVLSAMDLLSHKLYKQLACPLLFVLLLHCNVVGILTDSRARAMWWAL